MTEIDLVYQTRLENPEKLIHNVKNAATHSDGQIGLLANAFKKFGFIGSVIVGRDNVILAGHGRVLAAIKAGMPEIPVTDVSHLTDDEQAAYMIAENKLAELKGWDQEGLDQEITRLTALDFDLGDLGFIDDVVTEFNGPGPREHSEEPGKHSPDEQWETDDDEDGESREDRYGSDNLNPREIEIDEKANDIPEAVETRVKLGQVWRLNDHRLICGDSTSPETIDKLFQKKTAEFCFTSPPYADQRTYNGGKELSTEKLASFISVTSECVDLFAVNLGLSRKDHEIQFYWDDYIKAANASGLKLLSWNVWDKKQAGGVRHQTSMFAQSHEWIFVFGRKPKKLNNTLPNLDAGNTSARGTRDTDGTIIERNQFEIKSHSHLKSVLQCTAQKVRDEYDHPARFPVELPRVYIEACTNPGDTVYEPFGGSGTTLIACEQSHRNCLISELDPSYCDMILSRWEKFTGNAAVLEFDPIEDTKLRKNVG